MLRVLLILLAVILAIGSVTSFLVTRDGKLVTPEGKGEIALETGTFEAFPLPDYAAAVLSEDYKSYFVEVEPGIKIHVLEVGTGYPVYMQHGNPTSGFLYRKVAAALPTDRVRAIMPTMVGLGFSSKVPASAHNLDNHTRWMNSVLEQLALQEVVYVGQDWGGPVGMGALALSPGKLKGMVAMNTSFGTPKEEIEFSEIHTRVATPVVGELLLEVFVSVFDNLSGLQGDPASITADVSALYGSPVKDSGNMKAPLALMRMVPSGPNHPSAQTAVAFEDYANGLDIPVEIIWGMSDPILGEGTPGLSSMKQMFPDARVLETQAGHFLQEEVPEEIAAAVMRIVDELESAASFQKSNDLLNTDE
ncbi:MAG: alpha/beta fold hydrolase [Pseudomonadota bacterium]